ncbi:MAG: NADH-quinone oxidoreductase subunit NuoK [Bacteroidota bacterium]
MMDISLFLLLGIFLFVSGFFIVLTRQNVIMALMGVELMLNAANLNFIAFSQYDRLELDGQMGALFVIVLAAAEIAVGLAIVINVYKRYQTIRLDKLNQLSN